MRLLVALVLLLSSCSTVPTDKYLQDTVDSFKADAAKAGLRLAKEDPDTLTFVSSEEMLEMYPPKHKDDTILGLCLMYKYRTSYDAHIYILQREPSLLLIATIYHEAAHCLLRAEHFEADKDIMNAYLPWVVSEEQFSELKDKMFKRLATSH